MDELVINQNSSQCPSIWHQLGYLQKHLYGHDMPSLMDHLNSDYGAVFKDQPVDLYVARQWDEGFEIKEKQLITIRQ